MGPAIDDGRLLAAWALDAVAFADELVRIDPSWGTERHPLGGGWLVLCGAGLYVNRAIAVGIDTPLDADAIELIVERSLAVGVTPAVEVTPRTHPGTLTALGAAGFRHEPDDDVTALCHEPTADVAAPADVAVRAVVTAADLALWQETSARGWGHTTAEARRASDTFTLAAHAVDGDGMVIAFDVHDDRPLGVASVTVRDDVATLGGMSTVPEERGRGVQAAMLRHRLGVAAARGCAVAASTAATGGASERNLVRHGFEPRFVVQTWVRWPLASPA